MSAKTKIKKEGGVDMLTVREKFITYYVTVVTTGVCKKRSRSEINSKLNEMIK